MTKRCGARSFVLVAVLLAACAGTPSEATQLLAHGIVAGQNQMATAGGANLSAGVVEQMVRNSTGTLSLRSVPSSWRDRVLDLVVPRAFAQTGTSVNGSPVVGAVVCAVGVTDATLTPFTPCTNTGADGKATFFFSPGTKAGDARSEIRGTLAGAPTVFDTAKATVMPASYAKSPLGAGTSWPGPLPGGILPAELAQDAYANPVPYRAAVSVAALLYQRDTLGHILPDISVQLYAHTVSDTVGAVSARTIVVDSLVGVPAASTTVISGKACATVQVITVAGLSVTGSLGVDRDAPTAGAKRGIAVYATGTRCY